MNRIQKNIDATAKTPWFKSWFDSAYYHHLYQHRNDDEAKELIDALLEELNPQPGSTMLDLGCGSGRHSKYLASKGYNVLGMDLAFSSIREARKHESSSLHFMQADMRQPFGKNKFDFVFNFFTSFGYCKQRSENENIVRHIIASLRPGGTVVFDYLNVTYAEEHLVPVEEKEIDGVLYHINRWADAHFIYKRIAIYDGRSPSPQVHIEQVARFGLLDFEQMLLANGGEIINCFGDYNLGVYDPVKSKRLLVVAKKIID